MARFVLVPGAGGMAWYWRRVVPLIRSAGREAIAVDLCVSACNFDPLSRGIGVQN